MAVRWQLGWDPALPQDPVSNQPRTKVESLEPESSAAQGALCSGHRERLALVVTSGTPLIPSRMRQRKLVGRETQALAVSAQPPRS